MEIQIDPEKLKNDSKIYPNITPGGFLYDYRHAVNEAAFKLALNDPSLINRKGELKSLAETSVNDNGYLYKKKKSRSSKLATSTCTSSSSSSAPKLTGELRSKRISQLEEDIKEVKVEETLLEKSRAKARSLNQDDKARHFTQELGPVRTKKRKLEDELCALQKKEAKALQQKKKRQTQIGKSVVKKIRC